MVTKTQFADQLLLLLGRATPDSRIDKRELLLNIGQVRDELLMQEYLLMLSQDMRDVPADWLTPFTAAVQHDTVRDRDYVDLPFQPLSLPGDVGLFSLAPANDEFNPFVPTRPGDLALISHHPAFALGGRIGYWRETITDAPTRAWFQRAIKADSPNVFGQMVAPSASIKDAAPFPIPSHLQPRLIDLARQRYATKPAPDKVSNDQDQPNALR